MAPHGSLAVLAGVLLIGLSGGIPPGRVATVFAQAPQVFEFFVHAADAGGKPVTDLRPEDVVMMENGARQQERAGVSVRPLPFDF